VPCSTNPFPLLWQCPTHVHYIFLTCFFFQ
jgi:hypothetical protein